MVSTPKPPESRVASCCRVVSPVRLFALCLVASSLIGCEVVTSALPRSDSEPASLRLSNASVTLDRGDTLRVTAEVVNANGSAESSSQSVYWSSSDPSIVTVTRSGLVLGHRAGQAAITATSGDLSNVSRVTVSEAGQRLIVSPPVDTLDAVLNNVQLTATLLDSTGREIGGQMGWMSTKPWVATVDQDGLVTSVGPGTTSIIASSQELADTVSVAVTLTALARGRSAAMVQLSPSSLETEVNQSTRFSASVKDASGSSIAGANVVWSTSDPRVATISSNGHVTALSAGYAVIRATSDGRNGLAAVLVNGPPPPPVEAVVVTPAIADVAIGSTAQFTALAKDGAGNTIPGVTFEWSTTSGSVASVSPLGLVTGLSEGGVQVFATAGGKSGGGTLNVVNSPTAPIVASITIAPNPAQLSVGQTQALVATAKTATGEIIQGLSFGWSSSNTSIASVDGLGRVTAKGVGSASITATVGGRSATTQVNVSAPSSPPAINVIVVSPSSANLQTGSTQQFSVTAKDSNGQTISGLSFTWESSNSAVASISANGLVTANTQGTVAISARIGDKNGSAAVTVNAPTPPPPPPPPPPPTPPSGWDRVLADTSVVGDVIVPAGQRWLIGRNVSVRGNVRVEGTAGMRPGSTLTIQGANRGQYVGGGMTFDSSVANDWGVWVVGAGQLEIACTPKVGWNRTGSDPTWAAGDEYWVTPTNTDDFEPRRWSPGQPISRAVSMAPAAEVVNVTRDCSITGPGHIFISSTRPQRIEYVRLERMGIFNSAGLTTGRYALHFHMAGEGARGSVVRGVAAVNSEGRVFAPHASHGITFEDVVSVNSWGEAFWWDNGGVQHNTHDTRVQRILATGVRLPREVCNCTSMISAVVLEQGLRNVMTDAVVAGVAGSLDSHGFHWIPPGTDDQREHSAAWVFEDAVAHNISGSGVRWWTNHPHAHVADGLLTYRNGDRGVITGAYANAVRHLNLTLVEDNLLQHSSSAYSDPGGLPAGYDGLRIIARAGQAAIETGAMRLAGDRIHTEFRNCELTPGQGQPKVRILDWAENPVRLRFINCNLKPHEIEWPSRPLDGSEILGDGWRVWVEGGQVRVQ